MTLKLETCKYMFLSDNFLPKNYSVNMALKFDKQVIQVDLGR